MPPDLRAASDQPEQHAIDTDEREEQFEEVSGGEEFEEVAPCTTTDYQFQGQDQDQEQDSNQGQGQGQDDEQSEEAMYASLYRAAPSPPGAGTSTVPASEQADGLGTADQPRIFRDGKGQSAHVNISLLTPLEQARRRRKTQAEKNAEEEKRKKREAMVTPQDRANQIAAHKLHVLALLTWAKKRNAILQDDVLQGWLAESTPRDLVQQLKRIKPRLEPNQRERVRMFEAFLSRLTDWWHRKFILDLHETAGAALRQPDRDLVAGGGLTWNKPGRRADGWVYESPAERVKRRKLEVQRLKDWRIACKKRKNKSKLPPRPRQTPELTLFPPGSATTKVPAYLRLAPPAERSRTAVDLLTHAVDMRGSRETSASLFVALCRSLGIPARLVISPQAGPWGVSAAKAATSTAGGKVGSTSRIATFGAPPVEQVTRKGYAHLQSASTSKATSLASSDADDGPLSSSSATPSRAAIKGKGKATTSKAGSTTKAPSPAHGKDKGKATGQGKDKAIPLSGDDDDEEPSAKLSPVPREQGRDYRDEKWKNLDKPRNVKPKVKLRPHRPRMKASAATRSDDDHQVGEEGELEPVNLTHPPTVWAEVFSKPFQRWLTVDPIRGFVVAQGNRSMEPQVQDRDNKLVYVVAYEEDGYARDVTARYTRTLHSRVAKMRPPASPGSRGNEGAGEWWDRVVAAITRPEKLDRDAVEDEELEEQARKEPMPTSVAAFKDHPVYVLERHLRRDQAIQPPVKAGMVGNDTVYLRRHVLQLRNARGWMQQGRAIKSDEIPLKFLKSRAYTIEHKRAQVAAEQEGREEQDPLFAFQQTEPYRAPPVVDGRVPKNQYGRLDLFVPSMIPSGGAHINYPGAARTAKRLGVHYAEAVTGFEFRKFRGTPKISGIVVPLERAAEVEEECRAQIEAEREKAERRKEERILKLWRKLINAVQISARVHAEYGDKKRAPTQDGMSQLRAAEEEQEEEEGGGFFVGAPPQAAEAEHLPAAATTSVSMVVQQYGQDKPKVATATQAEGVADDEAEDQQVEAAPLAQVPGTPITEQPPPITSHSPETDHDMVIPDQTQPPILTDGRIATIAEMTSQVPQALFDHASVNLGTAVERGNRRINLRVRRPNPLSPSTPASSAKAPPSKRRSARKRKVPSDDEETEEEAERRAPLRRTSGTTNTGATPMAPRRSSRRLAVKSTRADDDQEIDAMLDQLE